MCTIVSTARDELVQGELEVQGSSTVVCVILLGMGLVLHLVNNLSKRKLDATTPGGTR